MKRDRIGFQVSVVMISLGIVLMAGGCAGKRGGSASGDESLTEREAGGPGGAGRGVESVKQDQLASVEDRPSKSDSRSKQGAGGGGQSGLLTPGGASPGSPSSSAGRGALSSSDGRGLGDIYFDFDQYSIRKDARFVLDGNAQWLRNETGRPVLIEGHCDERGTLAYNLVLGEKRARAAKRYLEDLGVPASRIQITSYGEVRPFCKDHNEGCWQQNRRAHFAPQ